MIRSSNIFNFGKWKGFTAGEVARRDPGYIYFCENEMGHTFTPKVKRHAYQAVQKKRRLSRMMEAEFGSFASLRRREPDFY